MPRAVCFEQPVIAAPLSTRSHFCDINRVVFHVQDAGQFMTIGVLRFFALQYGVHVPRRRL